MPDAVRFSALPLIADRDRAMHALAMFACCCFLTYGLWCEGDYLGAIAGTFVCGVEFVMVVWCCGGYLLELRRVAIELARNEYLARSRDALLGRRRRR